MSDEVMTRDADAEDVSEGAAVQDAPEGGEVVGWEGPPLTREEVLRPREGPPPTPPGLQVWQVWGRLEDTDGHLVLVASQDNRAVSIRAIAGELGAEGDMITVSPEGMSALILAGAAYLEAFEAAGGQVKA